MSGHRRASMPSVRIPTWQDFGASPTALRRALNLWPPFLFSGVRVEHIGEGFSSVRVRLRLTPLTRNYVGTQYGGSLYSMTDPFWMLILLRRLGDDYIVWDRAAEIRFLAPGRTDVVAEFEVTEEVLDELRAEAAEHGRTLRWFETDVVGTDGTVVARVRKQVYVRRKDSLPRG